jgi:hypothetical protein
VLQAGPPTLAVHDHRRRQDQTSDAGRGHGAQQDRRAEVVVGDEVGQVAEVDAETDHRGLVQHRVDARQAAGHQGAVADVTGDELYPRVRWRWVPRPGRRQERVECADLDAFVEQRGADGGADEACPSGDEDPGQESHRRAM